MTYAGIVSGGTKMEINLTKLMIQVTPRLTAYRIRDGTSRKILSSIRVVKIILVMLIRSIHMMCFPYDVIFSTTIDVKPGYLRRVWERH